MKGNGKSNLIGKIIFQQASLQCIYFTEKELSVPLPAWAYGPLCVPHLLSAVPLKSREVLRNGNQWRASCCDSRHWLCRLLRVRIPNVGHVNLRGFHLWRVCRRVGWRIYRYRISTAPHYSFPDGGRACRVSKKYSFFKKTSQLLKYRS